jgi:undecaprenyl diphosphate synthase
VIGDRHSLRSDILGLLLEAEETTRDNTSLTLVIAFNYGSRDEIARTMASLARDVEEGRLRAQDITPALIDARLDTAGIPDPDLIIRTSGEERLSNFLLWQAAYSEFVFVPEYWPDFSREIFYSALEKFASRDRRFGGLSSRAAAVGT